LTIISSRHERGQRRAEFADLLELRAPRGPAPERVRLREVPPVRAADRRRRRAGDGRGRGRVRALAQWGNGRARRGIDATYRERIEDARLRAVADHVRAWLWPS